MNARKWLMLIVMVMMIFNQTISVLADENTPGDVSPTPVTTETSATASTPTLTRELLSLVESTPTEALPLDMVVPENVRAGCNLGLVSQNLNVVEIQYEVVGAGEYPGHLDWGDGSGFDIPPGVGQAGHGYDYLPGGTVERNITLLVAGAHTPCRLTITIDDSPPPTPVPTETPVPTPTPISPPGSCTITATPREEKNVFDFQMTLPDTGVYTVDFGDQASDPGVVGISGTTWHGYSYTPGGITSYTVSVIGLGCQASIVIDDTAISTPPPEDDPRPTPSGSGGGQENSSFQETPVIPSGCRNGDGSLRIPEQGMLICWHSPTDVEIWANRPFNIQLGLGGAVLAGAGEPGQQYLRFEDTSAGHFILWGQEVGIRFRADGSLVQKAFEPLGDPGP